MVAFLSSGSGTNVTSRMGPTIAGMNFILWGPEGQRTLSHRNIIVLFEEAINHIFILNKERTNLIMWQTKQQQNMKPDNKKILSCYSPCITCREWIHSSTNSVITEALPDGPAHSPRLYHISLILNPIVFLMSPYLQQNSIKALLKYALQPQQKWHKRCANGKWWQNAVICIWFKSYI